MRHEELSCGEIIAIFTPGPLLRLTGFYTPASHLEHEGKPFTWFPKDIYLPLLSQGDGETA